SEATTDKGANGPTAQTDAAVPAGVPSSAANGAAADPAVPARAEPAQNASQQVNIRTDVYNLTFDTTGAQLVRAELLAYSSEEDATKPMVLLDNSAASTYLAQTGVVGAPQGMSYPTHLTPFQLVSSEREMTGNDLKVVFEAVSADVRVVKTYTLHRGRYDIDVRHDVYNLSDQAINPSVYLQLTRDGNDPPNTSFFYSTFTGPAVYSSEEHYQKIDFSDVDKGKAKYVAQANDGWIAMVQHYFATAWVPAVNQPRHNEVLKLTDNLY